MSQHSNSKTQPAPTSTAPGEPQELDKLPATLGRIRTNADTIRAMTRGEEKFTTEFCQWEEEGDGTATLCLVANEDQKVYSFKMPLLICLQTAQGGQATYDNSSPETRQKLIIDLTDRDYAREQIARERAREEAQKAAHAEAQNQATRARNDDRRTVETLDESRPRGLLDRLARRFLGVLPVAVDLGLDQGGDEQPDPHRQAGSQAIANAAGHAHRGIGQRRVAPALDAFALHVWTSPMLLLSRRAVSRAPTVQASPIHVKMATG